MSSNYYVIGRQEVFFYGSLSECKLFIKNTYKAYHRHINLVIAEEKKTYKNGT